MLMAGEWHIDTEHFVNQTEYSICKDAEQEGMPSLCLGVFRGIEELKGFRDMLRQAIADGRAAQEAREEYEQIIRAIEKEVIAIE